VGYPVAIEAQAQTDLESLVAASLSSLNAHDGRQQGRQQALSLFTDTAVIFDPFVIACLWPVTRACPLCRWLLWAWKGGVSVGRGHRHEE